MTDWRDRLRKIMEERGLDMKALSLAAGLGETAVRDMLKKVTAPRIDTVQAIAEQLGITLAELIEGVPSAVRRVPVSGYVSAGDGWQPFDGDGPIDDIEITLKGADAVALVVRGDSMVPVYRDGDVLIGTKRATSRVHNLIGQDCILETKAGERYVKYIARGSAPHRFNLRSYNPARADLENVQIVWAAPISMIIRSQN